VRHEGKDYILAHPDNWRAQPNEQTGGVILAPPEGMRQGSKGGDVGYGAIVDYYQPKQANASLWQATDELVQQLRARDTRLRAGREMPREIRLGSRTAIVTTLHSDSMFEGETEVDRLVTVAHPRGLFYVVFVAPESEGVTAGRAFDQMLQSLRLNF
jgi:hypothetical protein